MYKTFADLRAKRAKGENGFTLIELLVVVVILGVLIAIAIPVYLNYRRGANDAATESDVRNAVSTLEVCNASDGKYPVTSATWGATTAVGTPCGGQSITLSNGTSLKYVGVTSGASYMIVGTNSSGATKYYCYNSANGGGVKDITTTPAQANLAATTAAC